MTAYKSIICLPPNGSINWVWHDLGQACCPRAHRKGPSEPNLGVPDCKGLFLISVLPEEQSFWGKGHFCLWRVVITSCHILVFSCGPGPVHGSVSSCLSSSESIYVGTAHDRYSCCLCCSAVALAWTQVTPPNHKHEEKKGQPCSLSSGLPLFFPISWPRLGSIAWNPKINSQGKQIYFDLV